MRRMVKEDLLTCEGRPLFPERVAQTVPYQLTAGEQELYEQVTSYVREEMNRAARLEKGRRNTVGFALTVLQRRLASSPEAIFRSLERRAARLDRLRSELLAGGLPAVAQPSARLEIYDDLDEYSAEELENSRTTWSTPHRSLGSRCLLLAHRGAARTEHGPGLPAGDSTSGSARRAVRRGSVSGTSVRRQRVRVGHRLPAHVELAETWARGAAPF